MTYHVVDASSSLAFLSLQFGITPKPDFEFIQTPSGFAELVPRLNHTATSTPYARGFFLNHELSWDHRVKYYVQQGTRLAQGPPNPRQFSLRSGL
jgi:hypothetical protein